MDERYKDGKITKTFSNQHKLWLWQETELAVIEARVNLSVMKNRTILQEIADIFHDHPIDIKWWKKRDKEIHHDLNAFLEERLRWLPENLRRCIHEKMTSYDTEEPAFAKMLSEALSVFEGQLQPLTETLENLARRYRYTIMNGRTHGQEAELQTFGKRCLTWLVCVREGMESLEKAKENLKYSKLSGAIGNYRGIDEDLEEEALRILGFEPFYGATQIMPRELYTPLAQAICQIVLTLDKIATDIRLGARSGRPILQEPFGKKQKGSSAMPHKKNTISCEQLEGMARMAKGYLQMILDNVKTWEERAIEQSSVERVAWPDLFHVAVHSVKTMNRVLKGLTVYPDNMLWEIINSRGCYAAGEAKDLLRKQYGMKTEDAYRIVQLAAFNVFEPNKDAKALRQNPATSFAEADTKLLQFRLKSVDKPLSIHDVIINGNLVVSDQLEATEEVVKKWNSLLIEIFKDKNVCEKWHRIFEPSYLLRGENTLYKKILGDD